MVKGAPEEVEAQRFEGPCNENSLQDMMSKGHIEKIVPLDARTEQEAAAIVAENNFSFVAVMNFGFLKERNFYYGVVKRQPLLLELQN